MPNPTQQSSLAQQWLGRNRNTTTPQLTNTQRPVTTQQRPQTQQNPYGSPLTWADFSKKNRLHFGDDASLTAANNSLFVNNIRQQAATDDIADNDNLTDDQILAMYNSGSGEYQPSMGMLTGLTNDGQRLSSFKLPQGINPDDYEFVPMYNGAAYQMRPKTAGGQSYYLHGFNRAGEGLSTLEGYNRVSNKKYWNQDWIRQAGITPEQLTNALWATPTGDTSGYAGDIWSTRSGRLNQLGKGGNFLDEDDQGFQLTTYDPIQERINAGFRSDDSGTIFDYTAPKQSFMDKYGDQVVLAIIGAMAGGWANAAMSAPASGATAATGWAGTFTPYANAALSNMGTNAVTQYMTNGRINPRSLITSGLTGIAGQFANGVVNPYLRNYMSPGMANYLTRAGTNVIGGQLSGRGFSLDQLISPAVQIGGNYLNLPNWMTSIGNRFISSQLNSGNRPQMNRPTGGNRTSLAQQYLNSRNNRG